MSSKIIKPKTPEVDITDTGKDVSNNRLIRLFNESSSDNHLLTLTDEDDNIIGKITIPFRTEMFIQKAATDLLLVLDDDEGAYNNTDILATAIAFTD
jgi:hypothetical protein